MTEGHLNSSLSDALAPEFASFLITLSLNPTMQSILEHHLPHCLSHIAIEYMSGTREHWADIFTSRVLSELNACINEFYLVWDRIRTSVCLHRRRFRLGLILEYLHKHLNPHMLQNLLTKPECFSTWSCPEWAMNQDDEQGIHRGWCVKVKGEDRWLAVLRHSCCRNKWETRDSRHRYAEACTRSE